MKKRLLIAHSPDADDIFMYYAIRFGWVKPEDVIFDNIALDIETLNTCALRGMYDISAISFGVYPHIRNDYALLRCAVSFGQGYGPKLIRRKDTPLKRRFSVALSGTYTTNALLFRIAYPEAKVVYMNFLDIEQAVLDGIVDAGVLIHESILLYDERLVVEREIWDIWHDITHGELPLPLGGMAIRRSLPLTRAIAYERTLTQAVQIANEHKALLSKMLLDRHLVRIDATTLERYLALYANEDSIRLGETHYEALDRLFALGYENGFFDTAIRSRDFVIPEEYLQLRYT